MKFLQFLKSKTLLLNLIISVVIGSVFLISIFFYLGSYTNHGESISVPDFAGVKSADLDEFVKGKDLRYMIVDSIYDVKRKKGVVAEQDPIPGEQVKRGRTVYVTINAVLPPQVKMPNLNDLPLRQAIAQLEMIGLKAGEFEYRPSDFKNAVLAQKYKGKEISPETMIEKGSTIVLVLGDGRSDNKVPVPNFNSMTASEANQLALSSSVSIGARVYDESVKDTLAAKVYRQSPAWTDYAEMSIGSSVDLFFTQNADKIKSN